MLLLRCGLLVALGDWLGEVGRRSDLLEGYGGVGSWGSVGIAIAAVGAALRVFRVVWRRRGRAGRLVGFALAVEADGEDDESDEEEKALRLRST